MNKKLLLSIMLFCLACLGEARATSVYVGSDWNSSNFSGVHPFNVSRNYSLTQQIYAYHEIGMAGTITSIGFMNLSDYSFSFPNLQVYMKTTEKEVFLNNNDMVPVSPSDKVFDGTFSGSGADWVTITLDTPFEYDGESNLLICFYDPDPGLDVSPRFQTVDIDYYRSICHCHDTEIPDLNNLYNYNGFKNFYKERNIIRFDITSNNSTSLTVYNGTATNYAVPAYIYYFDEFTRSQFVIPAADLADMAGSSISSMTFYTTFSDVPHTTECAADVYLKEVNYTEISAFEPKASATPVYSGTFSIESTSSGGKMTINFSTPYTYGGGNLLVGIENNEEDAWREIFFYGQNVIGASIAGSSSSSTGTIPATQQNFIPKTTFNYTPASGACQAPTYLKTNQLTYHYVDLEWESVQNNGYWVEYKQEGGEWIQKYASIGQGCSISGFNASTTYYVRVRAKCLNGEFGTWITRHFTTPPACNAPYNVHLERLTHSYAWIRWDIDQSFPTHDGHSFQYKQASSSEWINLCNSNHCGTDAILPDLDPATSYNFRVRANCTNEHESEWVYFNFTTLRTPVTVPFTEPFTNGIPANWNKYTGLLSDVMGGTALTPITNGWGGGNFNNVFDTHTRLNIFGSNVNDWLVTPLVEIQNNDYQLSFDLALTKFSGMLQPVTPGAQPDDKFAVLVSTDGGASWTILREWNNTGSEYVYDNIATTGETVQINLSDYYDPLYGYAYLRIAFYGESTVEQNNGDNNLHIDNLKIEEIDPCAAPYNVTILSTTQHGFDVSFTPGAVTQTVWYFNYTTTNTTPPTDAPGNTTHTSFGYSNLPNLNSNTTYYLWMGTYCEEENTYHWSEPAEFTTTEACSKVYAQDVVVEETQPHSVTLSWEDYQGIATQWQVYYSYHNILPSNEEYINEVAYITDIPYVTIDSLYGDTDYHFWIRSYCGDWYGTPQWSSWSEMIDAHTLVSCAPPTNLVAHTTANSATIRWTPSDPSQNHWTVEITSEDWSDYPPYFEVDVPFITFNSDFLNGLVDDGNCYEKNYSVWVYTECGDPDGTSEAEAIDFIVTDREFFTVYDGIDTNNRIPAYIYYFDDFTRSQFIIPAEDLIEMKDRPVSSMTFYTTDLDVNSYTTVSAADVYLLEVNYTTFDEDDPQFEADGDIVYTGYFDIEKRNGHYELTINFDEPYNYEGGNLLVGVENFEDVNWKQIYFYGQTVNGASISGSDEDNLSNVPAYQQNFIPKTTFGFTPTCETTSLPYYYGFEETDEFGCWTMLDCDGSSFIHGNAAHTGSNGFQFHWNTTPPQYLISPRFEGTTGMNVSFYYRNYSNSYHETFQVGYSTTIKSPNAFIWGDTITASGQTWTQYENFFPEGTKYVAVKLTSYDKYYLFLDDFSFEPAYCATEDQCQLYFQLTDSWGDGWNGNAIKVMDVMTGEVLATLSNVTYDPVNAPITETYPLTLCDGRELRFEWVLGEFAYECSYSITDTYGEVILSGSGSNSMNTGDVLGTHTVDCTLKYIFLTDGDWNDSDNWNIGEVPPRGRNVIIRGDVTIPAGYTAVSNTVTLDGGSITVEDGGQLRHNTNNLVVTMKKNIVGYGDANNQNNFYLLAFPFTDDILVPAELTAPGCDLYMFDENSPDAEWRNNRQTPFYYLQMLDGYLFASPEDMELEMTGPTMRSVTYHFPELPAPVNPDNNFNGWYLLGNFYTSNAYIYTKNEDDEFVPMQVMVYNEEGELETRFAGPIPPMEGYFINLTEPTTVYFKSAPYIPTGAINGLFTVDADGDQVYFSKGNLQYIGSASTPYWKFADNQWEFLGDNGQNSTSPDVDRDLLGWGTSGYNHGAVCYQPWNTELPYDGYNYYAYGDWNYDLSDQTGQADWGYNAISNGGNTENSGWRTMTQSEWDYVFNTRTTSSGMRYVKASVNNVKGVILFPDDWKASYCTLNNVNTSDASFNSNTISESEWSGLEEHGAVFLPAAGHRAGNGMGYNMCCYWSSTHNQYAWAYYLEVFNSKLDTDAIVSRHYGHSVRLVRTVKK